MMSFSWKQYEGQVINNTFPLQRYLGGSSESAVFLTQLAGPQSSKAVLKLIPEGASVDLQLSLWRRASKLTHPNLLQLYQGGRCRLADMDLLYVVMEHAEENLSEILPQRALTPSEARDMLGLVLDALSNLHAQGLVHSHLKPSNILATSDQVKLSTDRLFPAGETRKSAAKLTPYDAPESANQALTAASDVWSLGVILIEVLTQRGPGAQPGGASLPSVPESLPQPFRQIAQHALERDPRLRWSIAQITASLKPRAAAAARGFRLAVIWAMLQRSRGSRSSACCAICRNGCGRDSGTEGREAPPGCAPGPRCVSTSIKMTPSDHTSLAAVSA